MSLLSILRPSTTTSVWTPGGFPLIITWDCPIDQHCMLHFSKLCRLFIKFSMLTPLDRLYFCFVKVTPHFASLLCTLIITLLRHSSSLCKDLFRWRLVSDCNSRTFRRRQNPHTPQLSEKDKVPGMSVSSLCSRTILPGLSDSLFNCLGK